MRNQAPVLVNCFSRRGLNILSNRLLLELLSKVGDGASGGAFDLFFSIFKFDPPNDLGDMIRSIQPAPFVLRSLGQFENHCHGGFAR